ncbi:MAG: glycine--tRNA ligase subunit beta, partial [Burkholderiaceae bacterium]
AVLITDVARRSDDKAFRQKLVPVTVGLDALGNATAALLKKLAALGAAIDHRVLKREIDGKQEVLVYEGTKAGEPLVTALQPTLDAAIAGLPIAKLMSYQLAEGVTTVQFVRPAHRLVVLHGHEVVPVHALGLSAGTKTHGHRFLAPGELPIHSADTYAKQLREEGRVIASFSERRARIEELLAAAAAGIGTPVMPPALLDEVTALVEWPVVYESGFESEFLEVPEECLLLTMQQNQKYFALRGPDGHLLNRFLLVSHIEPRDPSAIIGGNARVVRARLADARFFYQQDCATTLESRVPGLGNVVYHNKLGSQLERVERIARIAVAIAPDLGIAPAAAERAARLAKADLPTLMVGEFPELQGIMGEYYARHDGEPAEIAVAIREHYQPRYAGDALPESRLGTCIALADKVETLVGLFGIGEKPTGDKDPFALRRHALGVLRMLMDKQLPLPLDRLLAVGHEAFAAVPAVRDARPELMEFLYERLRGVLRETGASSHEVEAVVAQQPTRIDAVPRQLAAVRAFMELPEAESLAAANKRIGNILKKAESVPGLYDTALLSEPAERSLDSAFGLVRSAAEAMYLQGDYTGMLRSLAPLKQPVDRFFDEVMVNVDDAALRSNRLGLLSALRTTMNRVADISKLTAG